MIEAKWFIETYNSTGWLVDINEIGYDTEGDCQKAIAERIEIEKAWEKEVMDQYVEEMKNFLFDIDTSDREPLKPVIRTFVYKPKMYVRDGSGYYEVD